jgi:ATP-dependent Clp protease ATP-binding subunit ClpC
VFERFTEDARQVFVLAQDEARTLGHDYLGTEHLLAVLRQDESTAARVLSSEARLEAIEQRLCPRDPH